MVMCVFFGVAIALLDSSTNAVSVFLVFGNNAKHKKPPKTKAACLWLRENEGRSEVPQGYHDQSLLLSGGGSLDLGLV